MVLCENRPEGFGPKSSFSTHLPTTCFADVIVVPLATWIYLVALTLAILITSRSIPAMRSETATTGTHKTDLGKTRSTISKVIKFVYYFLIIAMLALVSVEIARASIAHLGIGLLPFTYAGLVSASILHFSVNESHNFRDWALIRRLSHNTDTVHWRWLTKGINSLFWILLMCTMAIKLATEAEELHAVGPRTGEQAKYPLSDAITDDAVMIGLGLVLLVIEIFN